MQNTNKSNVLLTELVIAVLFFSLISVTVVQMFVGARQRSHANTRAQQAMILAQDCAESLVDVADPDAMLLRDGFAETSTHLYSRLSENGSFRVAVARQETETSPAGRLLRSQVTVYAAADWPLESDTLPTAEPLAALPVASYIPDFAAEGVQP